MQNKYQAILFDLDGTLIDSAPDLAKTLNDILIRHGKSPLDYSVIRPLISYGAMKLIDLGFGEELSDTKKDALKQEFLDLYKTQNCVKTTFFPNILNLLTKIEKNNTAWGIITNKHTDNTKNIVDTLKLSNRTPAIVCGDTLPVSKPNPAPLLYACELLNVDAKQCVYIGDCVRDVIAGREAGMQTIACAYGYTNNEDVATWNADYIANQPSDIIKFL